MTTENPINFSTFLVNTNKKNMTSVSCDSSRMLMLTLYIACAGGCAKVDEIRTDWLRYSTFHPHPMYC